MPSDGCSKPQSEIAFSSSGFSRKSRKLDEWMPAYEPLVRRGAASNTSGTAAETHDASPGPRRNARYTRQTRWKSGWVGGSGLGADRGTGAIRHLREIRPSSADPARGRTPRRCLRAASRRPRCTERRRRPHAPTTARRAQEEGVQDCALAAGCCCWLLPNTHFLTSLALAPSSSLATSASASGAASSS